MKAELKIKFLVSYIIVKTLSLKCKPKKLLSPMYNSFLYNSISFYTIAVALAKLANQQSQHQQSQVFAAVESRSQHIASFGIKYTLYMHL